MLTYTLFVSPDPPNPLKALLFENQIVAWKAM